MGDLDIADMVYEILVGVIEPPSFAAHETMLSKCDRDARIELPTVAAEVEVGDTPIVATPSS